MKLSVAGILLLIAMAFPLLLNGQVFTNNLVGIVFACCSLAVANVAYWRIAERDRKRFWCSLTGCVALLLAVVLAIQLPSAYAFQQNFNRHIDELQHRKERSARDAESAKPQDSVSQLEGVSDATN